MNIMSHPKTSILFIGLLSAFSLLTFDLYQPSLPYITSFFGTTHSLSQLTLSIYLFVFGVTQLVWGPLIDYFGRRRLLPLSLLIAVFASLICAFAPNVFVLILGRALQGFALCCANLIAFSISRDFEDTVERAKVLSYVSMIVSISPIIAPVLGSIIFTYCSWQANFMLMAVIGLVLLLQARKGLFESPFWTQPTEPFIIKKVIQGYKEIIPSPVLWSGSLIMMFSFAAVMLSVINSSYIIIEQFGFSPLVYGIIFIINGLNIIVGNYLGIWLRNYFSMASTIYLGSWFIICGGFAMLLGTHLYEFNIYTLSFALICNLGISLTAPATMSIMLADYKENTGLALAIIHTVRMFGSSVLTIISAYLLMQTLIALPLGLIACGLGALYSTWSFNRLTVSDPELDGVEAA
ncbi:Inner membrane transport protein ydhC [Fluoribacter dumoffii]|uniref:Inner membrane transport protein ydhC n=2 Tax=Fluoribacter dumoffii TaxID=463 RepID=A0A377GDC0_9GAMM|nr:multidrug resistance protein D [Fluoribacter dumoffii NY 23]STO22815.1 Inner membrane transport protein ydhC [Fluoribacter dumoffii]